MQYVGKAFSTVSKFYSELNPATLSGAIDVVVVEQPNGELACSPFHVRFGKLSVLRPQDKRVEMSVNGKVVDFPMKVGDAGEAFFVFETEGEVPEELATSPLAGPTDDRNEEEPDFLDLGAANSVDKTHPDHDTGYVSAHSAHGSDFGEDEESDSDLQIDTQPTSPDVGSPTSPSMPHMDDTILTKEIDGTTEAGASADLKDSNDIEQHRDDGDSYRQSPSQDSLVEQRQPGDSFITDLTSDEQTTDIIDKAREPADLEPHIMTYPTPVTSEITIVQTPDNIQDDKADYTQTEHIDNDIIRTHEEEHNKNGKQINNDEKKDIEADPTSNEDKEVLIDPYGYKLGEAAGEPTKIPHASDVIATGVKIDKESSGLLLAVRGKGRERAVSMPPEYQKFDVMDHPFSDSEVDRDGDAKKGANKQAHRSSINAVSPLSDTELEYEHQEKRPTSQRSDEWSWGWGSLPVKKSERKEHKKDEHKEDQRPHDDEVESIVEIDGKPYRMAMSLCGKDEFGKDSKADHKLFQKNLVTYEQFSKDPATILNDKALVCKIDDRYYTWAVASPIIMSLLLYRQSLPETTMKSLNSHENKRPEGSRRFGGWSRWWSRGSTATTSTSPMPETDKKSDDQVVPSEQNEPATIQQASITPTPPEDQQRSRSPSPVPSDTERPPKKHYAKTLRLTSDQLKSLNLKKGVNTISFSVTSSYSGVATCVAKLFFWDHDSQVVISDIDGTITKSDALGHIFTMAGRDWTHSGVAKLYTDICNNGYQILYLTSRAIGQADYTRNYLKKVEQDKYQLPDGPVIMSPDRLLTAFHREVIMRKPEIFKMACLRDVQKLFDGRNPFYAGFGNRITDALSYRSVNVPASRIFTIDYNGEVKLELLSGYKSSYIALNDLVNQIFPDIGSKLEPEYNDWNYWKVPIPKIGFPDSPPSSPPLGPEEEEGKPRRRLSVIKSLTSSLTTTGVNRRRSPIPSFSSAPELTGNDDNFEPHSPDTSSVISMPVGLFGRESSPEPFESRSRDRSPEPDQTFDILQDQMPGDHYIIMTEVEQEVFQQLDGEMEYDVDEEVEDDEENIEYEDDDDEELPNVDPREFPFL